MGGVGKGRRGREGEMMEGEGGDEEVVLRVGNTLKNDKHAQKGVFVVFEREGRWRDVQNT